MLLVFIVATSMHQQVAKSLQIRKAYIIIAWNCLENTTYTHIATNTELKEVILWAASLRYGLTLYNHIDTREALHHDTTFDHCIAK